MIVPPIKAIEGYAGRCEAHVTGFALKWREQRANRTVSLPDKRCRSTANYIFGSIHYCTRHAQVTALNFLIENQTKDGPMLYTIGHAETYEKDLATGKHLMKKGKTENYIGGIVFETREDAQTYLEKSERLKNGYKVYGLLTNMTNTTDYEFASIHDVPVRALLRDAQIIRLD